MAKQVQLSAKPRSHVGRNSVKQLRSRGSVPANMYGSKNNPCNLEISTKAINHLLSHAVGENILVELEIDHGDKTTKHLSLIQEVQHHAVRGDVLHVDFLEVSMNKMLHTEVPLEPVGEAIGVKSYGGLLEQLLRHITIECLPKDLPESIRIDVSKLGLGDSLHLRDLILPEGVKATGDGDLTVFLVAEPKVAEESKLGETQQAPEVIKEKKSEAAAEGEKK
jgi:large subunit ribosomal protein L25